MNSSTKSTIGYSEYQKWYKLKRWKTLRLSQLAKQPYCQCPHHLNQKVKANVVDHIKPHKGDPKLFWNPKNLQSMLKACHDKFKQSQERGGKGFDQGSDDQGFPLNKDSAWYT